MELLLHRRAVVLVFLGITSLHLRGGAAMEWTSLPPYCAKNMSFTAIPSLADSVNSSFGGSISIEDVELLQASRVVPQATVCNEPVSFRSGDTTDCSVL